MGTNNIIKEKLAQYALLTASSLLIIFGNYFFKYPNNFVFGGVTGVSILLS
ncbi:MAG TPA: YitT family protein, partial [Oscillospiraceae bacterium]|nr:YitT family protein [Oscillospiraceae bacterium]